MKQLNLSFKSGQQLRDRMAMLPGVPPWKATDMDLGPDFPLARPATLYHRDSMECLQKLFSNPILAEHMDFTPKLVYEDPDATVRIYNEMMSGNWASETQVRHSNSQASKQLTMIHLLDTVTRRGNTCWCHACL